MSWFVGYLLTIAVFQGLTLYWHLVRLHTSWNRVSWLLPSFISCVGLLLLMAFGAQFSASAWYYLLVLALLGGAASTFFAISILRPGKLGPEIQSLETEALEDFDRSRRQEFKRLYGYHATALDGSDQK